MNNSPSPSPFNFLPSWVLFLIAVFVPSAVGLASKEYIAEHPWQALGLLLIFELLVGFVYLGKLVWQREFENDFVKAVANWLRSRITHPLGYQRYYRQHLYHIYRFVRYLALPVPFPIELERIFVEPTFVPEPTDKTSSDPIAPPKEFRSDKNSIWYYLAPEQDSNSLLILGGAGIGKSTLLQFIALTLANRKKLRELQVSYELPFLLSLHESAEELKKNEELTLVDAIKTAISQRWPRKPPPGWVERRLRNGRCLILLDGLDEVADSDIRQQVARWVQSQIDTYENNRFIITSRPLSHRDNPLKGVISLEVQGFTNKQIDEFVDKWYQATTTDPAQSAELQKRLHESKYNLHKLARNPLLLGMIIGVHQHRGMLPETRVELYKAIFEVYLGERWREVSSVKEVLSAQEKQRILQTLAYKMMEMEGKVKEIEPMSAVGLIQAHFENMSITPEQFLRGAENTGIWILGQFSGLNYRFAHLSFQEYLAAMYVKGSRRPELLLHHINDRELSWWRETIVLYCAQADPTPIMTACLKGDHLSEDALDLAFALYFEPEIQKVVKQLVKPEVREQFDQAVGLATEDKDIELRHKIANALLTRREQNLTPDEETPTKEDTMIDTSFIKNVEYQLFLDQEENHTRQPDHWRDGRFPTAKGLDPVLGVRPSDANAFCAWLTARVAGAWYYRLPTSEEAKNISAKEADIGYWTDSGNGFVWVKEKQGLLSQQSTNQSQFNELNRLATQDEYVVLTTSPKPDEHDLANYLFYADKLIAIQSHHKYLVELLAPLRERIAKLESILQDNHDRTRNSKEDLDNKIASVRTKKAKAEKTLGKLENLRTQYTKARNHRATLQYRLRTVQEKKAKVRRELSVLERKKAANLSRFKPTSNQRVGQNKLRQHTLNRYGSARRNLIKKPGIAISGKIVELNERKNRFESQEQEFKVLLRVASARESKLVEQLKGADEKERSARQQLKEAFDRESILTVQLEEARKNLDEAERQYSSFRAFAKRYYDVFSDFSRFASAQSLAISAETFAQNQALNLDQIFVNGENKKVLDIICALISNHIKGLIDRLDQIHSESNIIFNTIDGHKIISDISHALTIARNLEGHFDLIISGQYAQNLDLCLNGWISLLSQNRVSLRRYRRLRLYIRYFAKVLAQHISFWFPEEVFSENAQLFDSQSTYSLVESLFWQHFNLYLAFALLEARINGHLSACEGIIIARERIRDAMK